MPETWYQDAPEPSSSGSKSRSIWVLSILVALIIGIGLFVGLGSRSHTDPAPNGGSATNGAVQPAPAQNSK
jgi:hypothetical protein